MSEQTLCSESLQKSKKSEQGNFQLSISNSISSCPKCFRTVFSSSFTFWSCWTLDTIHFILYDRHKLVLQLRDNRRQQKSETTRSAFDVTHGILIESKQHDTYCWQIDDIPLNIVMFSGLCCTYKYIRIHMKTKLNVFSHTGHNCKMLLVCDLLKAPTCSQFCISSLQI